MASGIRPELEIFAEFVQGQKGKGTAGRNSCIKPASSSSFSAVHRCARLSERSAAAPHRTPLEPYTTPHISQEPAPCTNTAKKDTQFLGIHPFFLVRWPTR